MTLRRAARFSAYTLMCAAGLAAMLWPAPSVRAATSATSGAVVYFWAALLFIGGLAGAIGAATDRWLGEYVGLWPLMSTFAVYGIAALMAGRGPVTIAGGCAFLGIAAFMFARWAEVSALRREAEREANQ